MGLHNFVQNNISWQMAFTWIEELTEIVGSGELSSSDDISTSPDVSNSLSKVKILKINIILLSKFLSSSSLKGNKNK